MKNPSALRFLAPALLAGAASLAGAATMSVVTPGAEGQQAPQASNQSAIQASLDKARQLEVRGRVNLAAQVWQQVLYADPDNTEALGGLARAAKLSGNVEKSNEYLNKLRSINPNDPAIARVQSMGTQQDNDALLQQAGRLAQRGQYAQSMEIYHKLYGNNPPPGDLALSYYETEAASQEGRPAAIAGLRRLVAENPGDSRYQIALGRILTYNPQTRAEGRRLLATHPGDPQAAEALRQSLLWDAQNPATAGDIRAYLAQHPDAQLTQILKNEPAVAPGRRDGGGATAPRTAEQRAAAAVNATRTAADRAAYAQLNAKHVPQAEAMFTQILHDTPDDPNALAGMGYVRMQQGNFAAALNYLVQARSDGSKDPALSGAIATSSFFNIMAIGNTALDASDLPTAESAYKAALAMRPASPEALEAVGGTLLRDGQYDAAATFFTRFIKVAPNAPHAWRGLFLAQSQGGRNTEALNTARQLPQPVRVALVRDPLFLRQLATAYQATGQEANAQRVLKAALELPVPADAASLQSDTQLQYADLLALANHLDQAAGLYRLVLAKDQNNVRAWQGLVRVEHAAGNDTEALQTLESTPQTVYAKAMQDPGFESTVASIDQSQHRLDVAEDLLEKSIAQQQSAGQKPTIGNEVQLAGIYMARNEPGRAYPLYQQILNTQSDNSDAWNGMLSALHTAGRDREALAEVQQIPAPVRAKLEGDAVYLQTIGAVYNALGEPREAEVFFRRVQEHYASQHAALPADIEVQEGWLLYNAGDDAGLYRQLLELGSRDDLNDAQRRVVQTQWANFAVRRANQFAAAGNNGKAVAILNATAKAFPYNPEVTKVLAGGYASAGQAREAVRLWKGQDPSLFTVGDYRSAVGSALADNDSKDAETWLRFALNMYPRDPDLLVLAAKFEQARGDTMRAADYYRASLSNLPPADPGAEIAGELSRPANTAPLPRKPGQDLTTLLKPGPDDQSLIDQQMVTQPRNGQPYLPSATNFGSAPVPLMTQPSSGQPMNDGQGGTLQPSTARPASGGSVPLGSVLRPQSSLAAPELPGHEQDLMIVSHASFNGTTAAVHNAMYHGNSEGRLEISANGMLRLSALQQQTGSWLPLTTQGQSVQGQSAQQAQPIPQSGPPTNGVVYGPYVPLTTTPSGAQPGTAPGQPNVQYGPYVPYRPPTQAPTQPASGSTRLGATPPPARTMSTPEVTDILPTAKYVPNAKSRSTTSSHPEVNAAAARRRQSQPLTGESRPPAEDYSTTPTETVRYGQTAAGQNSGQVAQPSSSSLPPAATTYGAYQPGQTGDSNGQQYPQPGATYTGTNRARARAARRTAPDTTPTVTQAAPSPTPTQGLSYPGVAEPLGGQPYPSLPSTYSLGPTPTDSDLMSKRLPALGGRYGGDLLPPPLVLTPRQQTERDLETLESSYSGWLGGTASARYRSGTPGFDRLTDLEAGVEASVTVNNAVRFTVVPTAVFLNNGTINNANFIGLTTGVPILGTYPANAIAPAAAQPQSGVGGEFQVATNRFAAAIGYTPYEFLVQNYTGRLLFKPSDHVTFFGDRSAVTETELSYAGLRDPGNPANIWGGVVSTGGGIRFDGGDQRAGFYITADGADLTGYHVLQNYKFEGSAGAYFLAKTFPNYGRLNIGASLFGMHYEYNERGLTYGLGGYFSPDAYFLATVPITFTGHYKDAFHYTIAGAVGVQTFQEARQEFFPLDPPLQSSTPNAFDPVNSNTGGNYSINTEGAYRITEHWYGGGFFSANNTNNYNTVTGGFFVRYVFRPQFGTEDYPTGLFPVQGFRPLRVP